MEQFHYTSLFLTSIRGLQIAVPITILTAISISPLMPAIVANIVKRLFVPKSPLKWLLNSAHKAVINKSVFIIAVLAAATGIATKMFFVPFLLIALKISAGKE